MAAGGDLRPGFGLDVGGGADVGGEPGLDEGVEWESGHLLQWSLPHSITFHRRKHAVQVEARQFHHLKQE